MQVCNKFSYKACYFPALLPVFFIVPECCWIANNLLRIYSCSSWHDILGEKSQKTGNTEIAQFFCQVLLYLHGYTQRVKIVRNWWLLTFLFQLAFLSQTWCLGYAQPARLVTCINLHVTLVMFNVLLHHAELVYHSISFSFTSILTRI